MCSHMHTKYQFTSMCQTIWLHCFPFAFIFKWDVVSTVDRIKSKRTKMLKWSIDESLWRWVFSLSIYLFIPSLLLSTFNCTLNAHWYKSIEYDHDKSEANLSADKFYIIVQYYRISPRWLLPLFSAAVIRPFVSSN